MLHVHRSERADHLVAALGDILAKPLDDPLAEEVISVHSRGIERWIAQELSTVLGTGEAGDDGVCALVKFPFPANLVRAAVAEASDIDPDDDPWLPQRLTWPLLEVVADHLDHPMLGPLSVHLSAAEDPYDDLADRRFGAVRHIADLFDRYGVHRPEMVLNWRDEDEESRGPEGEPLPTRHAWQPQLWNAVRERVGIESFAERHAAALAAIRDDPGVVDLPDRIALFGLTAIPASYLTVLDAIAAERDVHLMLLHPSPDLWDRVAELTSGTAGQHLWLRDSKHAAATTAAARNPLLASWGRDVRELQLVAPIPPDPEARHHHAVEVESAPAIGANPAATQPTLFDTAPSPAQADGEARDADADLTVLQRIQSDIRSNRSPGPINRPDPDDDRPLLDPDDLSLQIHDCHGRLRQVEVLRDAVLHLLADVDDLELRDIIVMCPDVENFAPLVTAVFGADAVVAEQDEDDLGDDAGTGPADGKHPPALRVRLADRSLRATNPVLEVVSGLLELVDGRMTASAVLDLAAREPVRRRFHLDDDDMETVESWVTELNVRWGLDAAHRKRHGLPALHANSWRAGLERLHAGIAMADEDLRLVDGVAPYDGVEGQDAQLAGKLTELVERLATAAEDLTGDKTIEAWRDAITAAADALTVTTTSAGHDTSWQRLQLDRVLQDLVNEATTNNEISGVELSLGEVRPLLDDRLAGQPSRTSHRTGDLTVCTLVPMRSVPHRVVCLLGLDDDSFPRKTVPDSDDLLLEGSRVGDRDPRSEDRQLLLDAVLAATERLVVTFSGRDERTNEDRPPAVPVDELRDVVDRTVRTSDGTRASRRLTHRHPLQQHDPRNLTPGRYRPDERPWSFDPDVLAAGRAAAGTRTPPPDFLTAELDLPDEDVIELDDLVGFLQHPVKAFVRQRLDVTLPSDDDPPSDAIPSTLQRLDAWKVGDEMIGAWLGHDPDEDPDGGPDDTEEVLHRAVEVARARGLVPPGELATGDLDTVRARVASIVALCEHLGIAPGKRRSVDVEVPLPDGRLLVGTIPDVGGHRVESISYSRVKGKHRLATWARFLAAVAAEPAQPWCGASVGRHEYKRQNQAQARMLDGFPGDPRDRHAQALRQLLRIVDLYDRGRRAPIPLYCQASLKSATELRRRDNPTFYVDKEWETSEHAGFDNDDRDPYHLLVLGGQVPTEELFAEICRDTDEASWADHDSRFVAYAHRLWEPIFDAERTCET